MAMARVYPSRASLSFPSNCGVVAELPTLLAERRQRGEGDASGLPESHPSVLSHATEGQRPFVIPLSVEPFDREVAQLLDFVVVTGDFRQMRHLHADLGQLRG